MLVEFNKGSLFPHHQHNITHVVHSEILVIAFSQLPFPDFIKLTRVCRRFNIICMDILHRKYPSLLDNSPLLYSVINRITSLNTLHVIWRRGPLRIPGLSKEFMEESRSRLNSKVKTLAELHFETQAIIREGRSILRIQKKCNPFKHCKCNIPLIFIILEISFIMYLIYGYHHLGHEFHRSGYSNRTLGEINTWLM